MYYNLDSKMLAGLSVELGESTLLSTGAICTTTGEHKGRAPDAKVYVSDAVARDHVDWSVNSQISESQFDAELKSFLEYSKSLNPKFCQTVRAVRDRRHSIDVIVYTEKAKHALFVRNMFIPDALVGLSSEDAFIVYHFPNKEEKAKVIISLERKVILITGTDYAGEIKKSVFSVLNFLMPASGDLPMHCSVNVDAERKNPAIFFGLSGTGKTTLSSDENRILIGDDEHGWTRNGLTNFEGGCYAKTINLSRGAEPQIYDACNKPGTLLENVVSNNGYPDFDDSFLTENGRASYPCSSILGADKDGWVDEHPKNVIMLTCDAFGVLPAVMKLSPDDAVKQFLLGYTAKVAGTEVGVKEPQPVFSACFGAPFMPLPAREYAKILKDKIIQHDTQCWLVNTGWSGGAYGEGSRMPISVTRAIVDCILDGTLSECSTKTHISTGFSVPQHPSIPQLFLDPITSWASATEYREKALELMSLFDEQERKL
jgi:phosphoenolpyruvate carboxykinase (ATP)